MEYYKIISDPVISFDEAKYLKFSLIEEATPDFANDEWENTNEMEHYVKYRTIVDSLNSDIANKSVKYIKNVQDVFYYRPTRRSKNGACYTPVGNKTHYGNVNIYATMRDGVYYDIITNKPIPDVMIFGVKPISSSKDYKVLINHLNLIKDHKDLYEDEFADMLKIANINQHHLELAKEKLALREKAYITKAEEENQENNTTIKALLKEIGQI